MNQQDSQQYLARKQFFEQMLTIYGRKPVLEALQDKTLPAYRLHLADSNRKDGIIRDIQALAEQRDIETLFHSRDALARISRNGRQDQGVALDITLPGYRDVADAIQIKHGSRRSRIKMMGSRKKAKPKATSNAKTKPKVKTTSKAKTKIKANSKLTSRCINNKPRKLDMNWVH